MNFRKKSERIIDHARCRLEIPLRKWLNRKKAKVFVFADSRGIGVSRSLKKGNPLWSYTYDLSKEYCVDYVLLPEKHTTIADFFECYRNLGKAYDVVVLHALAVDTAPRPKGSLIKDLYQLKKQKYDRVFGEKAMERHLRKDLGALYEGEVTHNAFSVDMMREFVLPRLLAIPNLVFIGSNPILTDWDGSYWKKRPSNIRIIEEYSRIACEALPNSISLDHWERPDIMRYSLDNIHFSQEGMKYLSGKIKKQIKEILK